MRFFFFIALLLVGCAKERDVKPVAANRLRLPKSAFAGKQFYYLNSIVEVESPGTAHSWIPPGLYLDSDHIIQFDIQKHTLEVRSVYRKVQTNQPAPENQVLARLPIRNVDVVWKQNQDREDTRELEVTEERNDWKERQFIELTSADRELDPISPLAKDSRSVSPPEEIEYDEVTGSILFDMVRLLSDDTQVRVRYSFLPVAKDNGYEPRAYPLELETRIGYFKTLPAHADQFDRYGRVTLSDQDKHQKLNRWDPRFTTTYYFGPDFPEYLKAEAYANVKAWNEPFEKLLGHPLIRLEKNSGQRLGDLRYNLIHYDLAKFSLHGVLGYGPTVTHPVTGEIRKADVVLYGGTLRRAIFNERIWSSELPPEVKKTLIPDAFEELAHQHAIPEAPLTAAATLDPVLGIPTHWGKAMPVAELETFLTSNNPNAWATQLRDYFRQSRLSHTTYLSSDVLIGVRDLYKAMEGSDEAVEKKLVSNLINHELGHDLGLRHNMKASADRREYAKDKSRASSAMDYTYLITEEPATPGPYDIAALGVGYTSDPKKESEAFAQNFYYCTDEGLFSSLDPLCSQYDRGVSLVASLRSHYERYYSAYAFNNLRLDRVHFTGTEKDYLRRIFTFLLPIRQIHDHADAIVRAYFAKNYADLWYLSRERIQADESTKKSATVEVSDGELVAFRENKFVHGFGKVQRQIDLHKIELVLDDAMSARTLSLKALTDIIMNNRRPNYEASDELQRRVQVRGVLEDKLVSLLLVGAMTPDPLGKGESVAMFQTLEDKGAVSLFSALISNVVPGRDEKPLLSPGAVIADFDVNLRSMAVTLITKHLAVPGGVAESMDLLRFDSVKGDTALINEWSQADDDGRNLLYSKLDKESQAITDELKFRMEVRDRYQDLMIAIADKDDYAQTNATNEILSLEAERSKRNVAYSQVYVDNYFKGKNRDARIRYPSAIASLLRDNLNRLEDRWLTAVDTARKETQKNPGSSRAANFFETETQLHRAYVNEKIFAEQLFKTYTYK